LRWTRTLLGVLVVLCSIAVSTSAHSGAAVTRLPSAKPDHGTSPHSSATTADEGTNRGGLSRDGWYPEASLLTPTNVAKDGFGPLFSVPVTGQVYAQPVMDGSKVIVATEEDWVYGINQVTGVRQWAVQLGANVGAQPFNDVTPTVTSIAPWSCGDLEPYIGVTSTPVVDPKTGIIYVVAMEQLAAGTLGYFMHALNPANGQEEPNFPVEVEGSAQNDPSAAFVAYDELQRVALTLTGSVVYFGFSSHCDTLPYQGYVAGVSETGHLTALWTDVASDTANGAGIWQAGGGFASDASGQLLGASGNGTLGTSPSGTIPGRNPPTTGSLGESEFRLVAQKDGSLKATDFFTPYDAATLDSQDLDFGSGAPVLLPSQFGTRAHPHLIVQTGKEGYVYLLDAQNLGGVSAGDAGALAQQGPNGGAWATPGVWPGNGGYVYIPTANGGSLSLGNSTQGDFDVFHVAKPSATSHAFQLQLVAKGRQSVGFGTSSPITTSNAMVAGSAVVWIVQLPDAAGGEANLQAYDAVPSRGSSSGPGVLKLIGQWPVTDAVKFTPPGVGDNRLFVATKDGRLLVFGLHAPTLVTGHGATFASMTTGGTSRVTLSFLAKHPFTIPVSAGGCGLCTRTSQFAVTATSPAFVKGELSVRRGEKFTVVATFSPTGTPGYRSDVLRMVTSRGEVDFTLNGTGRAATPWVTPSTRGLTLAGYVIGQLGPQTSTVTFTNFGSVAARITGYGPSFAPFTISGLPKVGTMVAPGASFKAKVSFLSRTPGLYHRTLIVDTNSPKAVARSRVVLSAVSSTPPLLSVQPNSGALTFGSLTAPVPSGTSSLQTVTVSNQGGSMLTLKSVTTSGPYALLNPLPTNEQLAPGASVTLQVLFIPTGQSPAIGSLLFESAGLAPTSVELIGYDVGAGYAIPGPGSNGWQYGGSASVSGSTLTLTPDLQNQAGSAFWQEPVTSGTFTANFTASATAGTGGDGEALVLADTSALGSSSPSSPVGGDGDQVGFGGIQGLAVVIGEYPDPGTPSDQWVGIADGIDPNTGGLDFVSAPVYLDVSTHDTPNDVTVTLQDSTIDVSVDGVDVLDQAVQVPASFLLGFTAGNGFYTDTHQVSGVTIVVGGAAASTSSVVSHDLRASPTRFTEAVSSTGYTQKARKAAAPALGLAHIRRYP